MLVKRCGGRGLGRQAGGWQYFTCIGFQDLRARVKADTTGLLWADISIPRKLPRTTLRGPRPPKET